MRWKFTPTRQKRERKGDIRTIIKFAWLPVVTDDGFKIWLETFHRQEKLKWLKRRFIFMGNGRSYDAGPGLRWCHHKNLSIKR